MDIDIDWSKAPEGATHCNAYDAGSKWWKEVGECMYEFAGGNWNERLYWPKSLIPRPQPAAEWDGEGLPPVGVDIEILGTPEGCWSVGVVDYVDERHCIWHWKLRPNDTMHSRIGLMQFRPIRTKQQRLRDELVECIAATPRKPLKEIDGYDIADHLISEGWTKDPKP